jgi:putative transcriptional regulator
MNTIKRKIGAMRNKLRTRRLERGLTLDNVAQAVGLTKSAYGNIESGRRKPSLDIAFNLERFFGLPASELLAIRDDGGKNVKESV